MVGAKPADDSMRATPLETLTRPEFFGHALCIGAPRRHPRASGDPRGARRSWDLDPRLRGDDGGGVIAHKFRADVVLMAARNCPSNGPGTYGRASRIKEEKPD